MCLLCSFRKLAGLHWRTGAPRPPGTTASAQAPDQAAPLRHGKSPANSNSLFSMTKGTFKEWKKNRLLQWIYLDSEDFMKGDFKKQKTPELYSLFCADSFVILEKGGKWKSKEFRKIHQQQSARWRISVKIISSLPIQGCRNLNKEVFYMFSQSIVGVGHTHSICPQNLEREEKNT